MEKFVRVRQIDETIPKAKSMKNVKDDSESLSESAIEGLCNTVATGLRVLQPQPKTSKISKSQSCNTLNPQGVGSNTSKLPILNARQMSRGRTAELEETISPARPQKYGFHAGLKFPFKDKNAKPLDFKNTPSSLKNECFKNDKLQARPQKYGFHAGLKFPFKDKNAKPLDFKNTPSLPKNECFRNDKHLMNSRRHFEKQLDPGF